MHGLTAGRTWMQSKLGHLPYLQMAAVAGLFIYGASTLEGFSTRSSIDSMLVLAAFLGIAAAGQTLVILLGGLDLTVPSIIGAANLMTANLLGHHWDFGVVVVVVIGVAALVGAFNGFVSHRYGLPSLVVTIGTGSIVLGTALAATNGGLQVTSAPPHWLSTFSSPIGTVLGIPIPPVVLLWAAVGIALSLFLGRTTGGRRLYAAGSNPRAAELALVSVQRVWVAAFAFSGACAAAVGVLLIGFSGSGQANVGDPYLFTSLAAVVVGGTSLIGARGDYVRTALGALILILLTTVLIGHGADSATQEILIGMLLLVGVGIYGRDRPLRDRV